MREITTQEAIAVVGGMQEVHITKKKDDGSASAAALKGAVHVSGAGGVGVSGGGGGGGKVTTTVTCVDTIEQTSQNGGPSKWSFSIQGVSAEQIPRIESVKKTSVCTTTKVNSSK